MNLLIAGASTLGGFWTISTITAGISALRRGSARTERPHQGTVLPHQGTAHSPQAVYTRPRVRHHSETVLLVPLAGPWIAVGTHRHSPVAAVGLATLGIGQAVGLGMLIGGLSMSKEVRVNVPLKEGQVLQMRAAPILSPSEVGLQVQGAF